MKTIVTLDLADQPYGFPQLDGSGSLQATGSLYGTASWATNFSGSITNAVIADTASYVVSSNVWGPYGADSIVTSSYALTASYALNGGGGGGGSIDTGSFATTGSNNFVGDQTITGSVNIADSGASLNIVGNGFGQASLISPNGALVLTPGIYGVQINGAFPDLTVNGNISAGGYITSTTAGSYLTGSLYGTASWATNLSGTVTNATNASSGSNFVVTSTLRVDETLIDFSKYASTIVGSNNMFQQATGSWTSAHCKYTAYKGANSRAGEFITSWNGTTVSYYDNATVDIGSTSDITFSSAIVSSQIQINAVAASSAWTVKMLVTYL